MKLLNLRYKNTLKEYYDIENQPYYKKLRIYHSINDELINLEYSLHQGLYSNSYKL